MPQRRVIASSECAIEAHYPGSRSGEIHVAFPTCSEVERSCCTGLLACDESTGTVGTRLEANGMENTEEWRQKSALSRLDGLREEAPGPLC